MHMVRRSDVLGSYTTPSRRPDTHRGSSFRGRPVIVFEMRGSRHDLPYGKANTEDGQQVGAVGLGCMGMTWAYGKGDTERAGPTFASSGAPSRSRKPDRYCRPFMALHE